MASIIKTRSGTYGVLWYVDKKQKQKNFKTKAEAKKFAAYLELSPAKKEEILTVSSLLVQYRDTVTIHKLGARPETLRINRFLREEFSRKLISNLTSKDIKTYLGSRKIGSASIRKELTLLSTIFNYFIKEGSISRNPIKDISRPKEPEHRERICSESDLNALLRASKWSGGTTPLNSTQLTIAAFLFACKTGMRSGEILRIEPSWIEGRVIHIPKEATKTQSKRDVALCDEAYRILSLVRKRGTSPIFDLQDGTRDALWRRIRDSAGLGEIKDSRGRVIQEGLNFHDSRATFCTWAASKLNVLALARQTGHKNLKMLQRYYRASAEEIAKALN